jgi:hypothetical protein
MMLSPTTVQSQRQRALGSNVSNMGSLPPPTGGWNRRDVPSAMSLSDAITLENWIPDIGSVAVRKGYSVWGTTLSGNYVETLMQYSPPSGSNKLFAAMPAIIYDVTAQGAGVSSQTSLTNGRWSNVMFSTSAGNYLYICNGADTPRYYDGSSWTNSIFSGLTIANLDFVHSHLHRLWFIEKDTLNAWYAPTDSIAGALTKLPLGPFCKLGGKLVAIGTWTRDGGTGANDYLVFVTSKGQVVIYAGTDPSAFGSTVQIGVFKIAEPIGRRCLINLGSDLGVLTSIGLISLLQTLPQIEGQATSSAITDKVIGAFRDAYSLAGTAFGWQCFEYPKKNLLIINIPETERTVQNQFIMNIRTGAWAKFKNINAGCWSLMGDIPFFGGNDGKVYKFDTDFNDDGDSITATMQTAFSDFGSPFEKRFTMARGLFLAPLGYSPNISIKLDYDTDLANLVTINNSGGGAEWDVSDWDTTAWGLSPVPSLLWQTINGLGVVGSIAFSLSTQSTISFNKADLLFEGQQGGAI